MDKLAYLRVFCFLIIMFGAVFLPTFFVLFLLVLFSVFFENYLEGFVPAVFLDSLFFNFELFWEFEAGFFTLFFVLIYLVVEKTKDYLANRSFFPKLILGFSLALIFSSTGLLFFN